MPVWPERVRYASHPSDPRLPPDVSGYVGISFPEIYGPTNPTSPLLGPPAPPTQPSGHDGVHLPSLTYEQQQQVYQSTPWLIQQRLPSPVEIPVEYEPFHYEYIRLADLLGRGKIDQREADVSLQKHVESHASVDWIKRHSLFDDPTTKDEVEHFTWPELKQKEPALYLRKKELGDLQAFEIYYDFSRWYAEERGREEKQNLLLAKVKQAVTGILNFADPYFWVAATKGTETQHEFLGRQEYGHEKSFQEGKVLDVWAGSQVPAYTNIIIPFGIGAGFSAAFSGIGVVASTTSGMASKALSTFVSKAPWVAMGVISGVAGADIGMTYALEHKGQLPSGSGVAKTVQYGMQFGSAIAGASWFKSIQPKVEVIQYKVEGKPEMFTAQKYLFELGGKTRLHYGQRMTGMRSGFEPDFTSYSGVTQISESFLKSIITGEHVVPFKPVVKPSVEPQSVVSISQVIGAKKITFDIGLGKFSVEKIPVKTKPFDIKFKPPPSKPMSIENILRRDLFKVDLQKKMFSIPAQAKLADFFKGSFLVDKNIFVQLEKTLMLKGISSFKPKPEIVERPSGVKKTFKITPEEEVKFDLIDKKAFEAIKASKTYTLKDVVKIPPRQIKLFDKPIQPMKPFRDIFIPPEKKIMTFEEIYTKMSKESSDLFFKRTKPIMKTTQISLNKIFSFDVKDIILVVSKQHPSKPFDFKKPVVKPDIFKQPTGTSEVIQIEKPKMKQDVKQDVKGEDFERKYYDTKPSVYKSDNEFINSYSRIGKPRVKIIEEETVYSKFWEDVSPAVFFRDKKAELVVEPVLSFKPEMDMIKAERLDFEMRTDVKEKALFDTMLDVDVIQDQSFVFDQLPVQITDYTQVSVQDVDAKSVLDTITEQVTTTIWKGLVLPDIGKETGFGLRPTSFVVEVKRRQFVDGKRIRDTEWVRQGKPLSNYNALSLGGHIVDNNAKASFRLIPVETKSHKLPRNVKGWVSRMDEFYMKPDGVFVERTSSRIDSPGELREITYRGNAARRRNKKSTSVGSSSREIRMADNLFKKIMGG